MVVSHRPPLASIVVMSGYLPHESGFTITGGLENTPIWHGHGAVNHLVRTDMVKESVEKVTRRSTTNYTFELYNELAHLVNPQEVSDVLAFYRRYYRPMIVAE